MTANGLIGRLLKIKGIGYIALALIAGVGLLLINTGGSDTSAATAADKTAAFIAAEEQTLAGLGQSVCGVSCKAAVSVSGGYTYTYASDQSVRTVYNPDGTVAEKETSLTGKAVTTNGGTSLVPVKESPPRVSGVVMVCSGASLGDISTLKSMVKALYGLEDTAIFVTN